MGTIRKDLFDIQKTIIAATSDAKQPDASKSVIDKFDPKKVKYITPKMETFEVIPKINKAFGRKPGYDEEGNKKIGGKTVSASFDKQGDYIEGNIYKSRSGDKNISDKRVTRMLNRFERKTMKNDMSLLNDFTQEPVTRKEQKSKSQSWRNK